MNEAYLHGITAVAELKLQSVAFIVYTCADLHGITAVAELKPVPLPPDPFAAAVISTASQPWPN